VRLVTSRRLIPRALPRALHWGGGLAASIRGKIWQFALRMNRGATINSVFIRE
jgi:hypothetical protein